MQSYLTLWEWIFAENKKVVLPNARGNVVPFKSLVVALFVIFLTPIKT